MNIYGKFYWFYTRTKKHNGKVLEVNNLLRHHLPSFTTSVFTSSSHVIAHRPIQLPRSALHIVGKNKNTQETKDATCNKGAEKDLGEWSRRAHT